MTTPPDDTTEGLRKQLRTAILKAGREVDENALTAVIEALSGLFDPGDLPARMAEAIAAHPWEDFPRSPHSQHNFYGACAVCQGDVRRIAEVALSVRWEAAIQQAAEVERQQTEIEQLRAELGSIYDLVDDLRDESPDHAGIADRIDWAIEKAGRSR